MLEIKVPPGEFWDEKNEVFVNTEAKTLHLEHSLISISKWESKWEKPFLSEKTKRTMTPEMSLDYIRCMTINPKIESSVYYSLSDDNLASINEYVNRSMTATWIHENARQSHSNETVTSELIYYWMITLGIPFECEKWHINRLLTLIRVCQAKNNPKKMTRAEVLAQNRAINKARRAKSFINH